MACFDHGGVWDRLHQLPEWICNVWKNCLVAEWWCRGRRFWVWHRAAGISRWSLHVLTKPVRISSATVQGYGHEWNLTIDWLHRWWLMTVSGSRPASLPVNRVHLYNAAPALDHCCLEYASIYWHTGDMNFFNVLKTLKKIIIIITNMTEKQFWSDEMFLHFPRKSLLGYEAKSCAHQDLDVPPMVPLELCRVGWGPVANRHWTTTHLKKQSLLSITCWHFQVSEVLVYTFSKAKK